MTKRGCWIVAGMLVVAIAGCDDGDAQRSSPSSSASSSAPVAPPLAGTRWLLSDETDLGVPVSSVPVSAEFRDGRVAGNSGCNGYTAPYAVQGTNLTIGPGITSTSTLCADQEDDPMAVETAFQARLPQVASYGISGSTLTLRDARREVLLVFDASDRGAIVGEWEVTGYSTGDAVQSVIAGSAPTAEFEEGRVSGDGGCNTFTGPAVVSADTIDLGPLASTLRACEDQARQTQEQQYLAALELAATFRVTGATLELLRADGGIAVTFTVAPSS